MSAQASQQAPSQASAIQEASPRPSYTSHAALRPATPATATFNLRERNTHTPGVASSKERICKKRTALALQSPLVRKASLRSSSSSSSLSSQKIATCDLSTVFVDAHDEDAAAGSATGGGGGGNGGKIEEAAGSSVRKGIASGKRLAAEGSPQGEVNCKRTKGESCPQLPLSQVCKPARTHAKTNKRWHVPAQNALGRAAAVARSCRALTGSDHCPSQRNAAYTQTEGAFSLSVCACVCWCVCKCVCACACAVRRGAPSRKGLCTNWKAIVR